MTSPSTISVRCKRSIHEIAKDHLRLPASMSTTAGEWFHGKSGTGKSKTARDLYPGAYLKLCNKWWDGYQGEEVVIIDDFDISHSVLGHHLKIWGDHYPFLAEVKGGAIAIRPKKIIVTSNYSIEEIWMNSPQTSEPILRRYPEREFK